MHCVLFVVRANDLDEQRFGANDIDEKTYFSVLHSMQQYLRNKSKCLFLLHFIGRHKNYILQKRYYIKMYSNNLIIPHIYQSEHCDFDSWYSCARQNGWITSTISIWNFLVFKQR